MTVNAYGIKQYVPPVDDPAIERLAAADVVAIARNAATRAQTIQPSECAAYIKRLEGLRNELDVAILIFQRRAEAEDHTPEYLRPGAVVLSPLETRRIRLVPAADALFHE